MNNQQRLSPEEIITRTRTWVDKAVIGLNLCPFAKAVQVKQQIRYTVSTASTTEALARELEQELLLLTKTDPVAIDTTLLIHPYVLDDFLDYNDFLDTADALLDALGLREEIQIASFHPHYQFAGTAPDDIGNYTNRSPFPILHLLRESSVARAVAAFPEAEEIFERNIATMEKFGLNGWHALGMDNDDDAKEK